MYLEPAPGEAGVSNILKMAREGLTPDQVADMATRGPDGGFLDAWDEPGVRQNQRALEEFDLVMRTNVRAPMQLVAALGTLAGVGFLRQGLPERLFPMILR